MTRILVADDHTVVRRGLVQIISETMDLKVTGEAATAREVLDLVRRQPFDVVVLDLNLPDQSGLDTLKQLKAEFPSLPVLVLSMYGEEQYGLRVLRAGAAGYLTKEKTAEELVQAIRKVAGGGRYVSAAMADSLLDLLETDPDLPLHATLSDREFQVMRLLAEGKSVTEIADMLSLSVKTVSTYRARVLEKMNMKSNAELARYALEHALIH
ncbi:response regulator transcription factor [Rhodocaloribacter litoris]|uniref:response regulator n=1 Tax=Rhodocaloribacter litoris TaxID=2558931 RepID=UPI00142221DC|nr:response regulator transcription factor [Rhodocaloribacter litoris]QXD15649.1 response regulator transcription factor [Rhodocaloribacter litoris]